MIIKSNELNKIEIKKYIFLLFYGKNDGLKDQSIGLINKSKSQIFKYEESEILENKDNFVDNILTKSLFEKEKILLIKRGTDKILPIIEKIYSKKIDGIRVIINSETLEKKSKLRSFFERDKNLICVPFYPDTHQTLHKLTYEFFKKRKISISSYNINIILNKINGDRKNLYNELEKMEHFSKNKKKIEFEDIVKLINLSENHEITDLINYCLAKDKKRTINILNDNNFSNEDCILIIRAFLNRSKRILKLSENYVMNKNIDLTISSSKPPIFWKEKEITKRQVYEWPPYEIKKLIYKISEIELLVKNNFNNSVFLITNFILDQATKKSNN